MMWIKKLKSWAKLLKLDVLMLWFAIKNPNTPLASKAVCIFIVAYALSPIDLIPDFMPVLGYVDDLVLLPILIWLSIKLIPNSIILESRIKADEWLRQNQSKPKSYLGFLIVVIIWLLMLLLSYQLFQNLASWALDTLPWLITPRDTNIQ
jgi:uncharacterized membrane protein YkvA (DUF1232 family)